MPTIARLSADLGLDQSTFSTGLGSARRELRRTQNSINNTLRQVDRRFQATAKVVRNLGRVMGAIGAALVVREIVNKLTSIVTATDEVRRSFLTLSTLIASTGGTAGRTVDQINELAIEVGRNTLASITDVREAAAALLTFRSVSTDVFDDTLRRAQDLAALGFGTVRSATVQLGKALEDPIRGLTQLRRVGISFTQQQEDMIKAMFRAGRVAEAQRQILETLRKQIGGVGEAQGRSLAGAFDTLIENIQLYVERAGEASGVTEFLRRQIQGLAEAAGEAADSLTLEGRIAAIGAEIKSLRAPLEALQALPDTPGTRQSRLEIEEKVNELIRQRAELLRQLDLQRRAADRAESEAARKRQEEQQALRDQAEMPRPGAPKPEGLPPFIGPRDTSFSGDIRAAQMAAQRMVAERQSMEELARLTQQRLEANRQLEQSYRNQVTEEELLLEYGGKETAEYRIQLELLRIKHQYGADAVKQLEDQVRELERIREKNREVQRAEENRRAVLQDLGALGERTLNTLVEMATKGKQAWADFGSFARGILQELINLAIKFLVLNPIKNAIFGTTLPTLGGTAVAASAPGISGTTSLPAFNVPSSAPPVASPNVIIQDYSGQPVTTETRRRPDGGFDVYTVIGDALVSDLSNNGRVSQTLQQLFNVYRRGN